MDKTNKSKKKKRRIKFIVFLGLISSIYILTTIYFSKRFYFGSKINNINIAGKTVEEATKEITDNIDNYMLTIEDVSGKEEKILGKDILLGYDKESDKVQNIKDKQNPFQWFTSLFTEDNYEVKEILVFDEELLKNKINEISFNEEVIESKNPQFKYNGSNYEVIPEVYGTNIDKELLYNKVVQAIDNSKEYINLKDEECYIKPKYTVESPEIEEIKNLLDKYVSSKVVYNFGDSSEVIDGSIINTWISVDNNLNINFNESKMNEFLYNMGKKYNTIGITRSFNTSLGTVATVSGGDYGWLMDNSNEIISLIEIIKSGSTETKEPTYLQSGASRTGNDFGNTYVEINLTTQQLWFYKNGELITESPVVTGNTSTNCGTPQGVYILKYKQRDTILRGADYESKVSYWMPFNGGIGLHDATWRSSFGGNIYTYDGSHGCINLPFAVAEKIYGNIEAGTAIICYY